jgi:hypothetical protein
MSRAVQAPVAGERALDCDGGDGYDADGERHDTQTPRWVLWWRAHAWLVRLAILVAASPPLWIEFLGLNGPAFTGVMCRITFVILLMGKIVRVVRVVFAATANASRCLRHTSRILDHGGAAAGRDRSAAVGSLPRVGHPLG